MSFLIAWEVMSLGGAVMILGEGVSRSPGGPMLFMLALLEVGAVSILASASCCSEPTPARTHLQVLRTHKPH